MDNILRQRRTWRNGSFMHCIGPKDPLVHVVLLHGFGASGDDLCGLARFLDPESRMCFYFPEAPFQVPGGGRAWFELDSLALMARAYRGETKLFAQDYPLGLEEASGELLEWLRAEGLDSSRVVLGGFSQGSMVTWDAILRSMQPWKGALLFSSSIVKEDVLPERMLRTPRVPVFMSHGVEDTLLNIEGARALRDCCLRAGWMVEYHEFSGGHEIPPAVLRAARNWLNDL